MLCVSVCVCVCVCACVFFEALTSMDYASPCKEEPVEHSLHGCNTADGRGHLQEQMRTRTAGYSACRSWRVPPEPTPTRA